MSRKKFTFFIVMNITILVYGVTTRIKTDFVEDVRVEVTGEGNTLRRLRCLVMKSTAPENSVEVTTGDRRNYNKGQECTIDLPSRTEINMVEVTECVLPVVRKLLFTGTVNPKCKFAAVATLVTRPVYPVGTHRINAFSFGDPSASGSTGLPGPVRRSYSVQ